MKLYSVEKQHMREEKLKSVKKNLKLKESENVEGAIQELKNREQKLVGDVANMKELAKFKKQKNDHEIRMKQEHYKKKEEIYKQEVDTCLQRLDDITHKLEKSNQYQSDRIYEKSALVKTQNLIAEMKKEQAFK